MEKKIKFGVSVLLILGIVFASIGVIYVAIAIGIGLSGAGADAKPLPLVFGILGSTFLALGLVFLGTELGKRRKIRQLVNSGRYVWGCIVQIDWISSVTINNRHPQVAVAQYQQGGQTHFFTSRYLPRYFPDNLIGQQVRIYCQAPDFKHYYVDVEPLLQNQIIH